MEGWEWVVMAEPSYCSHSMRWVIGGSQDITKSSLNESALFKCTNGPQRRHQQLSSYLMATEKVGVVMAVLGIYLSSHTFRDRADHWGPFAPPVATEYRLIWQYGCWNGQYMAVYACVTAAWRTLS